MIPLLLGWLRAHRKLFLIWAPFVVLVLYVAVCRPKPRPIPTSLAKKIEAHAVASAVDTANVHRLERAAAIALDAQRREAARAARLDAAAKAEHARGDSLAREAARATTAHDSAEKWHAAYDARTTEVDSLLEAGKAKDMTLAQAEARADSLDRAKAIETRRADRADSVIKAAVKVVQASDPPCRVLLIARCPSRTAVAVGGAIVGAVVTYVVVHRQSTTTSAGRLGVPTAARAP